MIKTQGRKFVLYTSDGAKKLGSLDTKKEAEDREAEINRIKHAKKAMVEIELTVTKASLQDNGTMRWLAVCSDTNTDKTGEATSRPLFKDWIERIETGKSRSFLPPPRAPFLGLSHYPDLDGYGEAGITDKLMVDGNVFRAGGQFHDDDNHPLGKALFWALRRERDLIRMGETIEKPIRISAGWWDLAHSHGDFIFERKSLSDVCPMCKNGATDKVYLRGQLDHFAATRVPINPRTSLALEEKAMTTRKEDAQSIIDDPELAEELDKRAALTGKAETEELPDGMVVKAKDKKPPPFVKEDEEEMEGDEGEVSPKKKGKKAESEKAEVEKMDEENHRPFGGATSLDEAESYMQAKQQAAELYSQWSLFQTVMGNVLDQAEPGEVKAKVNDLVNEFGSRVAAIKAAVEDVVLVQNVGGNTMAEESRTHEGAEGFNVEAAVNEALSNNDLDRQEKAEAIQRALEEYAETIKAQLDDVAPPDPAEAVTKAMLPVVEKLDLLISKLGDGQQAQPQLPVQKSMAPAGQPVQQAQGAQVPVSPITGQPSKLRAMINRSVGMTQ